MPPIEAGSEIDERWIEAKNNLTQDFIIVQASRNHRKLKRGSHRTNHFLITIREITGEYSWLERSLQRVRDEGVPNYFGEQRFGVNQDNVERALEMFRRRKKLSRFKRGLYLSSARSFLFNQVLAKRVKLSDWNKALIGDALQLDGSNSYFVHDGSDSAVRARIAAFDLHPSGPMWGVGKPPVKGQVLESELETTCQHEEICRGFEQAGLKQQRRSLRIRPSEFCWRWLDSDSIELSFSLPRGAYATSVIRELINMEVPH